MREVPGRSVGTALAMLDDAVRYTLQWPTGRYTRGVTAAAGLLTSWGDDSTRWANTWGRPTGAKGITSAWRAPRTGQVFEIRFHTPQSTAAQRAARPLRAEQRRPGTPPGRARDLRARQDALFAAVPVPAGADRLTAPVRRAPGPAPAPLPARTAAP
ncbi:hypothetical protein MUU72_11115 [Streptomyces sp. RS10V-4]|uniref:hypothetical protein n=1 Tax=Streptomyces rhizoryzae TaxID=2932493 RepID=UPI0020044F19|nr:hypothetical protein [Streptomyces rhizoryzae]MCK7623639.1 hypothetical protein [Streptomyces rhizoryzae]